MSSNIRIVGGTCWRAVRKVLENAQLEPKQIVEAMIDNGDGWHVPSTRHKLIYSMRKWGVPHIPSIAHQPSLWGPWK